MAAIRAEHENQKRTIQAQKTKLDMIVSDLQELRLMGKDEHDRDATSPAAEGEIEEISRIGTPAVAEGSADVEMSDTRTRAETGELIEEKEEGEKGEDSDDDVPLAKTLNPSARTFFPRTSTSRPSTPQLPPSTHRSTPGPGPSSVSKREDGEEAGD